MKKNDVFSQTKEERGGYSHAQAIASLMLPFRRGVVFLRRWRGKEVWLWPQYSRQAQRGEGSGSLALHFETTDCLLMEMQQRSSGRVYSWCPPSMPGFTLQFSLFIFLPWKVILLPTQGREETYKLSTVTKSQLSVSSTADSGAFVLDYLHIRRISHIWVSERTGAGLW